MRQENTDVMKQGSFFQELAVQQKLGMAVRHLQRLVCYRTAMYQQDVFQLVFNGIVFVDEG